MRSVAAFGLLLLAGIAACSRNDAPPQTAIAPPETKLPDSCREVLPDEADALMKSKSDLVLLDMRVESEWAEEGHLPGAQLTNYHRADLQGRLAAMDRAKPYLVYCAIGERSKLTAVQMAELGFKEIYVLSGGLNAWKAEGKPVVK